MLKFTATIFILTFTLTSCSSLSDTGTNTLIKESSNKRHDKKAILFLKEAGATVADSYQVTICDSDHTLDKGEVGNTFTVDTNHGETILDTASINFAWFGNDTLQIEYDKKLRTFIQEKKSHGVTIIYQAR
jgi:hypothetical protein